MDKFSTKSKSFKIVLSEDKEKGILILNNQYRYHGWNVVVKGQNNTK